LANRSTLLIVTTLPVESPLIPLLANVISYCVL